MPTTQTPSSLVQAGTKTLGTSTPTEIAAASSAPTIPTVVVTDTTPLIITKFEFRKLFTLAERTTIDNIQYNSNFSGAVKATVNTILTDLNVSGDVNLHLADVIQGVRFLQQIGIITPARAVQILANQPPTE